MTEDFLQYIWKYRLFNTPELLTTSGEALSVFHPGQHNMGGGPDFLNAKLRIGKETWVGNVEVHIRSSDWHRHKHTQDEHYKNVILHVVFENDIAIELGQPGDLPVLVLADYIIAHQFETWQRWMKAQTWIPCQPQIHLMDELTWMGWKERLTIERLEEKSKDVLAELERCRGDWNETFYRRLARNFGFKANAEAMEMLAAAIPQSVLGRHKSDPFQVGALLFGTAGFLEDDFRDDYPQELKKEFEFLSKKFSLTPMSSAAWNFGRLRPANFPSIRIAQFAALVCKSEHLFSKILETENLHDIFSMFDVEAHEYWKSHFRFPLADEPPPTTIPGKIPDERRLGWGSIENIIINTASTVLFTYGRQRDDAMVDRALKLLEMCHPESNRIIDNWKTLGVKISTAADSQATLQLYNRYCIEKRCLSCQVGLKLLKNQGNEKLY